MTEMDAIVLLVTQIMAQNKFIFVFRFQSNFIFKKDNLLKLKRAFFCVISFCPEDEIFKGNIFPVGERERKNWKVKRVGIKGIQRSNDLPPKPVTNDDERRRHQGVCVCVCAQWTHSGQSNDVSR